MTMMRFMWILAALVVGAWTSGDDGQPPDKSNGDGHGKKDKDAALFQVAQVARRCHNADVSATRAVEETLRSYGFCVDPAWLARVVATAEAGTLASTATTSSSGGRSAEGGYQASWATSVDGAPRASGSVVASDGAVPTTTGGRSAEEGRSESDGGSASDCGAESASVAVEQTDGTGSAGGASSKASVGGSAATGSSIYDGVPEEDDERLQARMEADREQDAAIAAAARAAPVPVGRRVRIQKPGVLALLELDSRIRAATGIGPDDAICPYCLSCARMPRYLPCGNCGHPADNPRGNVACLACLQKQFDRHINGGLKCPLCREQLQRPADGDAFTGTEDALEHLTGVPLSRLVDLEKARLNWCSSRLATASALPAIQGAVGGSGYGRRTGEASEPGGDGAAGNGGATSDAGTGRGASDGRTTEGRVEDRAESGASACGNTPAPSEVSGRGTRSAVSDAQRWMRFSFALAAQLEQRARALRVLEDQRSWVAEREPTTSAGPSMAQIAARLDEMPEDLRFPPALLDALLTEAVGGAFVDLSDGGGCSAPGGVDGATERSESKVEATSEPGEESSVAAYRSVWEDEGTPEPEEQEAGASGGEATVPERTTSEADAALGPVPDEWLIAARSWHKAKKHFGKRGKRVRERIGFRCPCDDCQQSDGRFRGQGFRAYTWHFGKYPFKFRFLCPAEGCSSDRTNRNGLQDHLKSCHELQMPDEYEKWLQEPLGRFQWTGHGPTRLDPFFRPSPTLLIDEPLSPKDWRAYLAALRRPSASDEGGVSGGSEAELGGGGGVEGQSRAVSAERTEHSGGESTEAGGATTDGGDAMGAVVTGAAVLMAVAGGSGSGERSSKKKASKRDREATNGGDGATASKKRKPDGGDSDFNPESDEEQ